MRKPLAFGFLLIFGLLLTLAIAQAASADVITKWDFNVTGAQSAPYNSPAPTTGTGTAITLGMTNNVNGGNTTSDDVLNVVGTTTPSFNENMWRIRGTTHNGWYTHAAAVAAGDTNAEQQYSQGIELDASTAGFSNIQFSFDWYCTAQGIRDLQFQYNTNVANPAGWTNFGGTSPTGTYVGSGIPGGDFYNPTSPPGTIAVDLSSIAAANNDPNFGVRLVSAFDSTGNVPNDYASNALDANGNTVLYNNNSGNWRFNNLTFSGTAVPEPSSLALVVIGALGCLAVGRRRHP
jgi:PEP-CTERM motif